MKKFVKQFIKNPRLVGSIIPSSPMLADTMTKWIDFSKDITIIELWAGTWVFTKHILSKISANSKIIVFEIQEDFIKELKKIEDSRVTIIHDWAEKIQEYLNWEKVDIILSWLPFGSLPKKLWQQILKECYNNLKVNWSFIQFQYLLWNRRDIYKIFKNHSISWQPINFPPAFVYKCKKLNN